MSHARSQSDELEYQKIVYPGTHILRNIPGITDLRELESFERKSVSDRMRLGFPKEATPFSYDGLKAMHKHMFQDVYTWAGQERKYTTGRGAAPFAMPEFIESWMNKQFEDLARKEYFKGLNASDFAAQAASFVNEINAAHPFIDGNGRAQRAWLRSISQHNGYSVAITSADRSLWYEASRLGFDAGDNEPMHHLILSRIKGITQEKQQEIETLIAKENKKSVQRGIATKEKGIGVDDD